MCVKLPLGPENLNPDHCPPHSTSTCTCGMTIASKACGGQMTFLNSNQLFSHLSFTYILIWGTNFRFKAFKLFKKIKFCFPIWGDSLNESFYSYNYLE